MTTAYKIINPDGRVVCIVPSQDGAQKMCHLFNLCTGDSNIPFIMERVQIPAGVFE